VKILSTKTSSEQHGVSVVRKDSSTDQVMLNSRSFLRYDFSHLAVESELPLANGYWGLVGSGHQRPE
jgi:hypothetical protein